MFIRIHKPIQYHHGNTDSSASIITYLEKENEKEEIELKDKELFFSHENNQVSSHDVVRKLDKNTAKLTKKEAKFYMISINPSQHEQKHIAKKVSGRKVSSLEELTMKERKLFDQALKDYTREVMNGYANNFNKGLEGKDIMYFAKVEHERKYSRFDDIVLSGEKKAGQLKEGFQCHVHVVVSRKDITNKIRLSPFANHKNSKNVLNGEKVQIGFDRKKFVEEGEQKFDSHFQYDRSIFNSFHYRHSMKNGMAGVARSVANELTGGAYMRAFSAKKNFENMKEDPLKLLSGLMQNNPEIRNISKMVQLAARPEKMIFEVAKKIPSAVARAATIKI